MSLTRSQAETLLNTIEGLREENYWALRSEGLVALVALGGCHAAALTWNRSPGIR